MRIPSRSRRHPEPGHVRRSGRGAQGVARFAALRGRALDIPPAIYNHMVVDSLSTTLAAVADPTRRSILQRLARGPAPVGDLAAPFDMSQQAISKHLACLEGAGLVEKRREGRVCICSLRPKALKEVADWTEGYRRFWELNFQRLDALLDGMKALEAKQRAKPRGHPRR
jgi:DNA-binding transcriptional ArsR family regulator